MTLVEGLIKIKNLHPAPELFQMQFVPLSVTYVCWNEAIIRIPDPYQAASFLANEMTSHCLVQVIRTFEEATSSVPQPHKLNYTQIQDHHERKIDTNQTDHPATI